MAWALYLDALVPCHLWIGPLGRSPWSVQPVGSYGIQVLESYARQTKKFVLRTWNLEYPCPSIRILLRHFTNVLQNVVGWYTAIGFSREGGGSIR
jgi:hypothetical protein